MSFSWDSILNLTNETLLVVIFLILFYIVLQLHNHIPSQIKDLKKELKDEQKEIKADIRELNQKIDQNYKDMTTQNIQTFKDMTAQNNQNFKELVSLITKQPVKKSSDSGM